MTENGVEDTENGSIEKDGRGGEGAEKREDGLTIEE